MVGSRPPQRRAPAPPFPPAPPRPAFSAGRLPAGLGASSPPGTFFRLPVSLRLIHFTRSATSRMLFAGSSAAINV